MKYYQLYRTAEPKIVGVKTGASQVELKLDGSIKTQKYVEFDNYFSGYNHDFFKDQQKIESLRPPVFRGVLRKNAKVTDLMQYGQEFSYLPYLYSQKYIDIIKAFTIGNHYLFDFTIEDVAERFYLMFVEKIPTSEVKFDQSVIYTGHKVLNNIKYYQINTYEEFLQLLQSAPLAKYEKITISKIYDDRDIISIQATGGDFYSERLIDFLLDCNVTGLDIKYNTSIELDFK
ncbi:hypothetical protein [Flavobacterium silvaticum]|uniref:Uncharacterized protein n=1 Tax=Flavobacterium silvaticum TaxID=1852020 RepID=A0A972FIT4_9FLAO|nr:hypothetical protein [Flavobacterium silvaticum]NMH26538.1 hypothetical protein [Flavobacterium silvaticum]